ncbi:MAG TPA: response regulator [Anaeromyxobacter sp.]|nr:response regulator [Anaeromyxobacter sp.]
MAPKILLVDDNQELLALLGRLVEAEGWSAVGATRGKAAIEKIRSERLEAAVVDVLLPDMMGYDVAQVLREGKVPFVFITGVFKGGRAAQDARLQQGASGYFEKPFESKKLVEALRALLPGGSGRLAPPPPPPAPVLDLDPSDFDVELAVEAEEPVPAMDLTGRVVLTEGGRVSAVLKGATIHAGGVGTPARPPPSGASAPPPRPAPPPPPAGGRAPAAETKPQGRIAENLPDLITAFYLLQQTGELTLQKGKVKKTFYFDAGRPCFAISNLVADRFGPFLVRAGKITQAQLELCQAAADKTGRRTGDVLVEMGLLKETEKLYYVAQQVKAIIYSVFGWEEGEYRMHFTDRAEKEALKLDLHPASLITRGVKKLYKPERLYRLLSPEDRLIPSPQPAYGLHEVELDRWEAELLPRVDGTRTVAEIIHVAQRPEHVVYGFLYGMVALKILDRT